MNYSITKLEDDEEIRPARPRFDSATYDLKALGSSTKDLLGEDSRYNNVKQVEYLSGNVAFRLPAPWLIPGPSSGASWKYFQVPNRFAYRPDLIASFAYNDPTLWWWILYINNMLDFEELETGITIRLPFGS